MYNQDDGVGAAMAQSYVEGRAADADSLALDCLQLVYWLSQRIRVLEEQAGIPMEFATPLPSEVNRGLLKYQKDANRAELIRNVYAILRGQVQ